MAKLAVQVVAVAALVALILLVAREHLAKVMLVVLQLLPIQAQLMDHKAAVVLVL
jgi:hypothetical protein